jgi:hypothetical protein
VADPRQCLRNRVATLRGLSVNQPLKAEMENSNAQFFTGTQMNVATGRYMTLRLSLAFPVSLLVAQLSAGNDSLDCWAILAARAQSMRTFQADVLVEQRAGADRQRLAEEINRLADEIQRTQGMKGAHHVKSAREGAKSMAAPYSRLSNVFRYLAQPPDLFRLEQFGLGKAGEPDFAIEPIVRIFAFDRWSDYVPASRIEGQGEHKNQLLVRRVAPRPWQFLEVMRGQCVPTEGVIGPDVKPSARASALGQLSWTDLRALISPDSLEQRQEPLPQGKELLPFLTAGVAKYETGYSWRVRLWLDPSHGYHPLRLECQFGRVNPITKEFMYLPYFTYTWSDFLELANGMAVAQRCDYQMYQLYSRVEPGKPDETWVDESFEIAGGTARFTNIKVDAPLQDGAFRLVPSPETDVIDQVKGELYAVGSTGEILEKHALEANLQPPLAPEQRRSAQWTQLLVYTTIGLVLLILVSRWYRRHILKSGKNP